MTSLQGGIRPQGFHSSLAYCAPVLIHTYTSKYINCFNSKYCPSSTMASGASVSRFKLVFRVPTTALAPCKAAIFSAGVGRFPGGQYTECCFTTVGTGQFRPGDTASPYLGKSGEIEEVQEARVETLCIGEDVARNAVKALKE